jgi:hypothetical protein
LRATEAQDYLNGREPQGKNGPRRGKVGRISFGAGTARNRSNWQQMVAQGYCTLWVTSAGQGLFLGAWHICSTRGGASESLGVTGHGRFFGRHWAIKKHSRRFWDYTYTDSAERFFRDGHAFWK